MKDTVILYHNNCSDGFGGVWAARRKFGKKADYIGVQHHNPPPLGLNDKEVYIIDFSYRKKETDKLLKDTKSLTLIDHHVTAKDVTESVPNHIYDINHSGAVLAWNYFFPDEEVPLYLKYVEDIDLWKFKLPRAEDFMAFSATVPFDLEKWDKIVEDFENEKKRNAFLDRGKNLLEYQKTIIDRLMENAEQIEFEGKSALAINSSVLSSQIGNAIVKKGYDVGIVWFYTNDGGIKISLRSDKDGEVDVGKIAKIYGGGGHKSSAAFVLGEDEKLPWQE